jgi:hypothetical protein
MVLVSDEPSNNIGILQTKLKNINDLGALKTSGYEEGGICTEIYSSEGRIFARFF